MGTFTGQPAFSRAETNVLKAASSAAARLWYSSSGPFVDHEAGVQIARFLQEGVRVPLRHRPGGNAQPLERMDPPGAP